MDKTMNKKMTTLMLGIATVLLASCSQNEDVLQTGTDGTLQAVTITATTGGSMTTRSTNAQGDNEVTRCLIQIFEKTTGAEGQELQPMEGYETPKLMTGSETGGFNTTATLNPTKEYSILFWADEGENAYTYDGTEGLQSVTVAENAAPSIAYAGSTEWSSTHGITVSVDLKHVVAKVTVQSTTAVAAGKQLSLTVPSTYTEYNVQDSQMSGTPTNKTYTYTVLAEGSVAGGDVFSCYVLAGSETQSLTLRVDGVDTEIPNVPLAPNKHTILKGDVGSIGLKVVTFICTTDAAWGSEETKHLPPYRDLSKNNIIISDAETYYITTEGVATANTINISGNATVYLEDVNISATSGPAINITGGNPTINIKGENNSVSSTDNTGIAVSGGATVTIKGNSTADVLTAKGNNGGAGIGSPLNGTVGGNISIDNVTIHATGGGGYISSFWGGAGIGSSCNGNCGDVTIMDAVIVANGGKYSPGIGMGYSGKESQPSIGTITITNSDVTAKAGDYASAIGLPYSEGIGVNPDYKAGQIIITTDNFETFLSKLTAGGTANVSLATYAQRIGVGSYTTSILPSIFNQDGTAPWEGVEINGDAYPNGVD